MSCRFTSISNSELHTRYAALCDLEKAAGERADARGDAKSNREWEKAWDELTDFEDVWLKVPAECAQHIRLKQQIIQRRAEAAKDSEGDIHPSACDVVKLLATLQDQTAEWECRFA